MPQEELNQPVTPQEQNEPKQIEFVESDLNEPIPQRIVSVRNTRRYVPTNTFMAANSQGFQSEYEEKKVELNDEERDKLLRDALRSKRIEKEKQ